MNITLKRYQFGYILKGERSIKVFFGFWRIMKDDFKEHLKKNLLHSDFRIHFEAARARRDIARGVAEMRKRKGITQQQLARKIGTRQSNISRLESAHGERMPSLELLGRVAKALGGKMVILFKG